MRTEDKKTTEEKYLKYFAVGVAYGHVGDKKLLYGIVNIRANTAQEAAEIAIDLPHVKHDKNYVVFGVQEITNLEYWMLKHINDNHPLIVDSTLSASSDYVKAAAMPTPDVLKSLTNKARSLLKTRKTTVATETNEGFVYNTMYKTKPSLMKEYVLEQIETVKTRHDYDESQPINQIVGYEKHGLEFYQDRDPNMFMLLKNYFPINVKKYAMTPLSDNYTFKLWMKDEERITNQEQTLEKYIAQTKLRSDLQDAEKLQLITEFQTQLKQCESERYANVARYQKYEEERTIKIKMLLIYTKLYGKNNDLHVEYHPKNQTIVYPNAEGKMIVVRIPNPEIAGKIMNIHLPPFYSPKPNVQNTEDTVIPATIKDDSRPYTYKPMSINTQKLKEISVKGGKIKIK